MSITQVAAAAVRVFPDVPVSTARGPVSLPAVMVAIAGPQSNWAVDAPGDPLGTCPGCSGANCRGFTSWGAWQIHNSTQPFLADVTHSQDACVWATWLNDPVHNAEAAWWLIRQYPTVAIGLARGWGGAAGLWDSPAVERAMPQAERAVRAARRTGGGGQPAPPAATASSPFPWAVVGALGGATAVLGLGLYFTRKRWGPSVGRWEDRAGDRVHKLAQRKRERVRYS